MYIILYREREKAKTRKKNSLKISEREKDVEGAKCGEREREGIEN